MYRERRKELPALPKTRAEVHETLSNISVLTNKEENFLPMNDQDKGIVNRGQETFIWLTEEVPNVSKLFAQTKYDIWKNLRPIDIFFLAQMK